MASLKPIKTMLVTLLLIITCKISLSSQSNNNLPTISAEPALLPYPPLSSPALSPVSDDSALTPDIFPLFPTPASSSLPPPSKSSLPIIPSSPGIPDPEVPHPEFSISPTGSMPESSAFASSLSLPINLAMVIIISIALLVNAN